MSIVPPARSTRVGADDSIITFLKFPRIIYESDSVCVSNFNPRFVSNDMFVVKFISKTVEFHRKGQK